MVYKIMYGVFSLVTKLLCCISHINNIDIVVIFKLNVLQQNVFTVDIKLYDCLEINHLLVVVAMISVAVNDSCTLKYFSFIEIITLLIRK